MGSAAVHRRAGTVDHVVCARDGVRLAVRDQGCPEAEHTVVLLHGLCLTRESWSGPARVLTCLLGERVRIISYDHRGHGRSGRAAMSSYHVGQLADDLADVLKALAVDGPVTLAGHSMGGMAAVTYCARPADSRPVQPTGLVMVASSAGRLAQHGLGRLLASPAPAVLATLASRAPAAAVERALTALAGPACDLAARCGRCGPAERQALCSMCTAATASTMLTTAAGFLPHLRRFDQIPGLASVQARTIVLSGGRDIVTPAAHARQITAGITGAEHRHYPTASHMMLHEHASDVAAAVVDTFTARPAHAAAVMTA